MEITIPFNFKPRPYQLEILKSPARYKIAVMHRRSGKSKTALNQQIARAMQKKGLYVYLLPTARQAKKIIWMDSDMMQHFPPEIVEKKNEVEMYIKLKNGSIFMLGGADDPSSWLGLNVIDAVLDEFADMKPEIWTKTLRPMLSYNKGSCTFIGTLKGRNHFWQMFSKAEMSKDNKMWQSWIYNVNDTKAISDEELDSARLDMPDSLYRQEFLCEAIEDASAFFKGVDKVLWSGDLIIEDEKFYKIGIDLGKYNDYTVLAPMDRHTMRIGKLERFNQLDWTFQKMKIAAFLKQYKQHYALMDSTGLGDPIFDDLSRTPGINIHPFQFTSVSREPLLKNLAIMIEQKKIMLPDDPIMLNEMKSMVYSLKGGKVHIGVPDSQHDDTIMSIALACWTESHKLPAIKKHSQFKSEFQKEIEEMENENGYDNQSLVI